MKPKALVSLALRAIVPSALMLLMSVPADAFAATPAQDHLVSPQAMQKQMADSAVAREKNIETVRSFLSSPVADRAMRDAHYSPEQVKNAIPSLSDQELASLGSPVQRCAAEVRRRRPYSARTGPHRGRVRGADRRHHRSLSQRAASTGAAPSMRAKMKRPPRTVAFSLETISTILLCDRLHRRKAPAIAVVGELHAA